MNQDCGCDPTIIPLPSDILFKPLHIIEIITIRYLIEVITFNVLQYFDGHEMSNFL